MARRVEAPTYPIRAVARLTGLSVDTLRAWERRYEAVVPQRGDRGRVYNEADISRLKQLAELVARGHAIGTVAGLPANDLTRLIERTQTNVSPAVTGAVDLVPLFGALEQYDLGTIEEVLSRHAAILPPRELIVAVVLPLMEEIGRRWETGRLRPAQEHLVSAITRSVLGSLLRSIRRPNAPITVVFATLTGERHELGLLSAAVLAASAGWSVLYLGADLPASDIAHAVDTAGASAVVLSMTSASRTSLAQARLLGRALSGVPIGIGGPEGEALVSATGEQAHHLRTLDDVVPMLTRYANRDAC